MKIESSAVSMQSSRVYTSYTHFESLTLQGAASSEQLQHVADMVGNSEKGSLYDDVVDYRKEKEDERNKNQNKVLADLERMRRSQNTSLPQWKADADGNIKALKKILEMLRQMRERSRNGKVSKKSNRTMPDILDLRSPSLMKADALRAGINGVSQGDFNNAAGLNTPLSTLSVGTSTSGSLWKKVTITSGEHSEAEAVSFKTNGLARTSDGREISFGVEVSMARSFYEKFDRYEEESYIMMDPLIINMDSNVASLSDMKFKFDLDADGKQEEISFAKEGSGFLAYDKNGDGIINDGSELFGTKSGDGFKDLAAYDEDGNGWIDEGDSIYDKLRVWTKDADGNDTLIDLKSADVGAIYLTGVDTQFHLNNETNHTDGIIQKTGIYLKESGGVGTVNHVDLAM